MMEVDLRVSRGARVLAGAFVLLVGTGCVAPLSLNGHGAWAHDYDTAERRLQESDRDLLVFYLDDRPGRRDAFEKVLKSAPIRSLGERFVCCTLIRSYEPDRRYVSQYGVHRAPGVIRVHRDGTYHSATGIRAAFDVLRFVDGATPPGAHPELNPHIPREARYDWMDSIEDAERRAHRTARSTLIVFYRSWSGDWRQLEKLLTPHEVFRRLAGVVHGRVAVSPLRKQIESARFGTLRLPALVLVQPDGGFSTLELPPSSESVTRFADAALQPARNGGDEAAYGVANGSASPSP